METKIIFEDGHLLVLDKPAGMVVNKAETTMAGETVQEWVEKYMKVEKVGKVEKVEESTSSTSSTYSAYATFILRAGIVHRLDKETSGLLLVAKTPESFTELQRQFKAREVKKKYLALVVGKVEPREGEINAPVGRLPWDRKKFGVFPGGREASTKYKTINNLTINNPSATLRASQQYSLLEVSPTTGRTHQIRVHLKYLGYPVVADDLYAGRKQGREQRKWCPRLFLHAAHLEFTHPKSGKRMCFESKLPEDLEKALSSLKITIE
ncbi:MAG: RluA family pseudouridine synthase [bacterium]|nr:RluA family pseudouridine synthase [bacterium]